MKMGSYCLEYKTVMQIQMAGEVQAKLPLENEQSEIQSHSVWTIFEFVVFHFAKLN